MWLYKVFTQCDLYRKVYNSDLFYVIDCFCIRWSSSHVMIHRICSPHQLSMLLCNLLDKYIIDCFNCIYRLHYSVLIKFMHMFISVNLLPLVGLHTVVLLCWHCNHGIICTLYCFYSFVCDFYVSLLYFCLY
jgi:hypothetical protein